MFPSHLSKINFLVDDILTTIVSFGTSVIIAPGEVKPGHMILAPLRTNLIAPLSTCCIGRKNGSRTQNISRYFCFHVKFCNLTFVQ